jgi:hypothetical protein
MEDAMRFKLAGAIVAGLLLTAVSAAPADAATNTITVGSVTLTARVLVMVPVTVVCDPLQATSVDSILGVTVTQASGKAVATGETFPAPIPIQFTCDSVTQNNRVVDVFPNAGSPPFHGGKAVVQAFFAVVDSSTGIGESGSTTVSVSIRG